MTGDATGWTGRSSRPASRGSPGSHQRDGRKCREFGFLGALGSVQTAHVDVEAIEEDVLHLAGREYRAVLEVSSLNFALQGEREREVTVAGYAAFLNALTHPLQILVRILPLD